MPKLLPAVIILFYFLSLPGSILACDCSDFLRISKECKVKCLGTEPKKQLIAMNIPPAIADTISKIPDRKKFTKLSDFKKKLPPATFDTLELIINNNQTNLGGNNMQGDHNTQYISYYFGQPGNSDLPVKMNAPQPCPPWYEGKNCETEMRKKFYGTYSGWAREKNNLAPAFQATLVLSPGDVGIKSIYVYWGQGNDGKAVAWTIFIIDANSVNVPPQQINNNPGLPKGNAYTDAGSGFINGNQLTFNWTASTPGGSCHWSMVLDKD